MQTLAWRLAGAGLVAAALVGVSGRLLERARFGSTDEEALARVEAELRQRFDASADSIKRMASRVASQRTVIREALRDPAAAARLFAIVDEIVPDDQAGRTGVTVYGGIAFNPIAWAGRVSELPKERLGSSTDTFIAPGALGPRLIRVETVIDRPAPAEPIASVAVEQTLEGVQGTPGVGDTFVIATALAPVAVRTQFVADSRPSTNDGRYSFVLPARDGGLLIAADVNRADVVTARTRWRSRTRASVAAVLAVTLLLCAGPLVDRRRAARGQRAFLTVSGAIAGVLVLALILLRYAVRAAFGSDPLGFGLDLLLTALAAAAVAAIGMNVAEQARLTRPRLSLPNGTALATARLGAAYLAAGLLAVLLLAIYSRFLQQIVTVSGLDVLHFSLHPASVERLAVAFGLVLLHAAVIWSAALVTRGPAVLRRSPRRATIAVVVAAAWSVGAIVGALMLSGSRWAVPMAPLLTAVTAAGACAVALTTLRAKLRRASQAMRLVWFFLALLGPAVAMYPSLVSFATDAKERLIATEYAPLALSQRDDLKSRLYEALDQIDQMTALPHMLVEASRSAPTTDPAFQVWSHTDLAVYRIISAIELYGADGRLISRFANLPEYETAPHQSSSCGWDLIDEPSPFGSSVRHVLSASRAICQGNAPQGSIVVRVMLDYTTLPFISSPSPYLESLRPNRQPLPEGAQGRDIDFAVYGWSRVPIYSSGTSVWSLPDDVFERTVASREAFWTTLERSDRSFRVYLASDRSGIYALGYPLITWFGHLINLAELVVLAGVLYAALVIGSALFAAAATEAPASGRALLREIRSSFYWKVFLFSLAGAVVPVVILALATRTYFAQQFRNGVNEAAAETATVAQRLVEDYASLQQRGTGTLTAIDDQIMVLVARAIDHHVNLYDRTRLQATSERDLFASGLLSMRTPGIVFERLILERLPTTVGIEQIGDFPPYRLAAAPVRAGGREGLVTVPLSLRQDEIERQIDELDRQVVFAAVLFSLLGAAIGYWMAERIADPVNRLSHATRRIARGDLDARIAATSADELGRLVQDFNRMAEDLTRQRAELERTQRLEAWADMARQVAHDIKNPLTPIQLSAEHARRINIDRGRPLSPVLEECVNAILTQVALLRQIASEFSSFASSPTARPEPTRLPELIEEVVSPYRAGLAGRVIIDVVVAPDLPPVLVDRALFARALTNIIENALHAMPAGGTLTIRIRPPQPSAEAPQLVTIEVSDTGVGMDAESLARIFEPYFSTKATGTGLGLTIAKRNVELNRGTIHVESERGVGTVVTVALPVA